MAEVILGLGVNLGDRLLTLRQAVRALGLLLSSPAYSPVYESAALLPENAPPEWNMAFLNMAVRGETELAPMALLAGLQSVERTLGRQRRAHWGPREIDIDILAYGQVVINEPALTVPHAELLRRDFALVPLADVAPDWVHPLAKKTARELAAGMATTLTKTEHGIA